MQQEDTIQKINRMLIEEFEIEEGQINADARFKEDFDIDSLDFVDLVVIIERNFGFKVKGEDMVQIKTLGDFYKFILIRINPN
jgi:acyl carrier protein